jgi:hypothetical protein
MFIWFLIVHELTIHEAENFQPNEHSDLTPTQLAAFYKSVGGSYDVLFLETPANAVAYIYQSLGCLHSLQPEPGNDGFAPPMIPALKPRGFITWQTIQLLLGPEEHVPFIQSALQQFDIVDPETGSTYPKILPKECFPEKPDPDMVRWYEDVSERLKREHDEEQSIPSSRSSPAQKRRDAPIIELADSSADEKNEAAKYFANPMYRDRAGKPSVVRRISRAAPRKPVEFITNRGRAVVSTVRHLWNPHLDPPPREARRRSWHGVSEPDDDSDIGHMGLATNRRHTTRRRSRDRVRSASRGSLSSSASSTMGGSTHLRPPPRSGGRGSYQPRESDTYHSPRPLSPPSSRHSPRIPVTHKGSQSARHSRTTSPLHRPGRRLSHDSPNSPTDYFPSYPGERDSHSRRHSASNQGKRPSQSSSASPPVPTVPDRSSGFSPSTGASFAAHIAHMQGSTSTLSGSGLGDGREGHASSGRERTSRERPRLDARGSASTRHSRDNGFELPPRHGGSVRSARRDRDRNVEYDERAGRSHSSEGRYNRERRQRDRNRGHEREPERDSERPREIEREPRDEGDRRRRRARFAEQNASVTDGVDGRRYPDWT